MKFILFLFIMLVLAFVIFQIYLPMSSNKTAHQPFTTVQEKNGYEIRFYPESTMATITSSAKSYKELGSSGFRKLANYIFGGNAEKRQISMTSPVHMDINDSISSMSFVMPGEFNQGNLPKPNDASVAIHKSAEEYVAVLKFGGFASDADIKSNREKLEKLLKADAIPFYGNFRFLGYNTPYQLFGRKNEIIVGVKWDVKGITDGSN